MIEEITTNIVKCDGPNCDEVYADVVPVSAENIAAFANRDGWIKFEGNWYCLECQAAATVDHYRDKEIAELQKQAKRDEKQIARLLQGKFKQQELDHIATTLPPDDLTLALLQARRTVAEREGDAP